MSEDKREVAFVNDMSDITKEEIRVTFYGKAGEECDPGKAIITMTTRGDKAIYHALMHLGSIYDPTSIKFPKDGQYRKITKACFEKFLLALKSGDYGDYEKAAREYRRAQ